MVNYATNIALVQYGFVTNIIWGLSYNIDEFNTEDQIAVQIDDKAVRIGNRYENGEFYDENGVVVKTTVGYYEDMIRELDEYIIESTYEDIIAYIEED